MHNNFEFVYRKIFTELKSSCTSSVFTLAILYMNLIRVKDIVYNEDKIFHFKMYPL